MEKEEQSGGCSQLCEQRSVFHGNNMAFEKVTNEGKQKAFSPSEGSEGINERIRRGLERRQYPQTAHGGNMEQVHCGS